MEKRMLAWPRVKIGRIGDARVEIRPREHEVSPEFWTSQGHCSTATADVRQHDIEIVLECVEEYLHEYFDWKVTGRGKNSLVGAQACLKKPNQADLSMGRVSGPKSFWHRQVGNRRKGRWCLNVRNSMGSMKGEDNSCRKARIHGKLPGTTRAGTRTVCLSRCYNTFCNAGLFPEVNNRKGKEPRA
ncbi:uncharacterized protein BT62DRAFT_996828 [Guyanagaster necrorhizus]|uniref:Uncharacterized protein n=1 Tax=Guyanagaster necrorhizus TaxID=856835 RepID=A0A9P8AN94_9AGAR|nr:uncharacterized protein BT62DRAFT_996828 [Guyanagaster necrorhizus MCA 3950]KAG7442083.1 hypothetical protein BT62DRAFT_996828 [Guyanagaster necrorhizus MCA 3950]